MSYIANPDATMQYVINNGTPAISFEKDDGNTPPFFAVNVLEPKMKENYTKATGTSPPAAVFYTQNHASFVQLVNKAGLPNDELVETILNNIPKYTTCLTPRDYIELTNLHMGRIALASLKHRLSELDPTNIEDLTESTYIDTQIQWWENAKAPIIDKEHYDSEEERVSLFETYITHYAPHALRINEGNEPVTLLLMNTLYQQGQISSFFYETVTSEIKEQIENSAKYALQQWQEENHEAEFDSPWIEKLGSRTGMGGRGVDSDND